MQQHRQQASDPSHTEIRSTAFDAVPANTALIDSQGVILAVNQQWRRFAIDNGFAADGFGVGDNYLRICAQARDREYAGAAADGIRKVLSGAIPRFELEYPCHSRDQERWFVLMVTPLPAGAIDGAVIMHVDVTARRKAEDALQQAKEKAESQARRLALMSDVSAQLLLHERPEELMQKLFEKMSSQLGLEVYFNFLVHPCGDHLVLGSYAGISEEVAASIQRLDFGQAVCGMAALERQRRIVENVQSREDEMTSLIRSLGITAYACNPLLARGSLLGTLSFGTRKREGFEPDELELMRTVCDHLAVALERARLMDELVQRGREAREASMAAEEANRTKDEFLAALSHELRTPLTPVLLAVQSLAANARFPAELRPELERMRRNIEVEARLIDDLLDLTRIARGKVQLHHEIVDLHGLVRHAVEICGANLDSKHLRLCLELEAAESFVWGDPARLGQIFWNLLSNAIKFTDPGGEILLRTEDQAEGVVKVEVTDTGIGIEPEVVSRIFDAFEQGDASTPRRFGGLGLGLAISKTVTDLHGGSIHAHSWGRGQGATFTVCLKTVPRPLEGEAAEESRQGRPSRAARILLIEDHVDTADALADLLGEVGHKVILAHSVGEALAQAKKAESDGGLDLVISDLGLPDGSGHDLMAELKRLYDLKGIALSGYGMDEDLKRSEKAGFEVHLTKPVSPQALFETILRINDGG